MSDQEQKEQDQLRISNGISHIFFGLIGVLSLLAAGALVAYNANDNQNIVGPHMSMAAGSHMVASSVAPASTLTVAMRDPGCHWFKVGNSYKAATSVTGPVNVLNADEAAIKIAGPNGTQTAGVGNQVTVQPGKYTITMVGQAPDDNHLHLAVS